MRKAVIIIAIIVLLVAGGVVALDMLSVAPSAQKVEQLVPDNLIPR